MSPVYKLSANSVKNGRTVYGSMLAGNTAFVPPSFESIATITVGSTSQSSLEFTSIPSTYTHLQLRYISRNDSAGYFVRIRFNSDTTASNYVYHIMNGTGAALTLGYDNDGMYAPRQAGPSAPSASIFCGGVVDILDYTNTNKYKTIRGFGGHDNNGAGNVDFISGFYKANTNAITSIQLTAAAGNYVQYSHFALYGIREA